MRAEELAKAAAHNPNPGPAAAPAQVQRLNQQLRRRRLQSLAECIWIIPQAEFSTQTPILSSINSDQGEYSSRGSVLCSARLPKHAAVKRTPSKDAMLQWFEAGLGLTRF